MLGFYLAEKCKQKLKENVSLIQQKLANPSSIINVNVSGSLVDAAKGGMSGLSHFAGDYLEKNSDALLMSAIKATGAEKTFTDAFNLAMNLMAMALMANNNLVLKMMQEQAKTCMTELAKKDLLLIELSDKVKEMYVALASLVGTSSLWDSYYDNLRKSLALVAETRTDLTLVKNTFKSQNFWLATRFDGTVKKLETARDIITPKQNNPAIAKITEGSYAIKKSLASSPPDAKKSKNSVAKDIQARDALWKTGVKKMETGLAFFGDGLSDSFPFPTNQQQWQATLAIGKISKQLLTSLRGYAEQNAKCVGLIAAFKLGLDSLTETIPGFLKTFVISLIDKNLMRVDTLTRSMALTLNGDETYVSRIKSGIRPNSLSVSVTSFKWIMDINLILEGYKLIPSKQLGALALQASAVNVYSECVANIKAINDMRSGLAVLRIKEGEEQVADLETQILALILEANNAVVSASIRKGILGVAKTVLSRLELSLYADHLIYTQMNRFYYTELEKQAELTQMFNGMARLLGDAGLDRALGCLLTGDFKKLFKMNAREASYVGAALASLALLKTCFKTTAEKNKANDIASELASDADLLNISFSINFDLAIFKNLQECLRLGGLSDLFSLQELICGFANDIVDGKAGTLSTMFTKMNDLFSF